MSDRTFSVRTIRMAPYLSLISLIRRKYEEILLASVSVPLTSNVQSYVGMNI